MDTAAPSLRREPGLLEMAALLPLLTAGFVNLAAEVRAGPVSGMGAATAVQSVLLAGAAALAAHYPRRLLVRTLPIGLFLLWALLRSVATPPTFEGAQNFTVYLFFAAGVVLAGTLAARDPARTARLLGRGVGWMQVVLLAVVLANLAAYGVPQGGNWRVGPRSMALVALVPFHWHLARWSAGHVRALAPAALWFAVLLLAAGRTALAISLVSVGVVVALLAPGRPRRAAAGMALLAAALAVAGALVAFTPRLHARFFSGDTSLRVGQVAINASGRVAFWGLMVESARTAPVAGHGLGSSQRVMADEFLASDRIRHPHNDYLRLWHDLGLVGLALLVAALGRWAAALLGTWRRARAMPEPMRVVPLLALLTVVEILLAMVTDNVLIYPFFLGAAGVVIGTALGMGLHAPADAR